MTVIGNEVKWMGLSDALIFVEDDDVAEVVAVETDLDLLVSQIDRGFEANIFEREGIVVFDLPFFFCIKEFMVGLIGREETDAFEIHSKTINGFHANG